MVIACYSPLPNQPFDLLQKRRKYFAFSWRLARSAVPNDDVFYLDSGFSMDFGDGEEVSHFGCCSELADVRHDDL